MKYISHICGILYIIYEICYVIYITFILYIVKVHKYNQIFSHKNKILPFETTWMNLKGITLHEISLPEKRQILYYFFLYVECKKTHKNYNVLDTENRLMVARVKG